MHGPPPLSVEEAQQRVLAAVAPLPCERVALTAAARRVLAESVRARHDNPPFDNSAMDGFAVRAADCTGASLPVVAQIGAGDVPAPLPPGSAARIFTGAPLPPGADCVVMQEAARLDGATVVLPASVAGGRFVRPRGDDVRQGEQLIAAGTRLGAADIGTLAGQGMVEISVFRRPRVAVVSTGNELTAPGTRCAPYHIYDVNGPLLATCVADAGGQPVPRPCLPDAGSAIRRGLLAAAAEADVVLVSGGVSVGEHDLVRAALAAVGDVSFWRVALKPGKPLAFGHVLGKPLFGLPGNPVSSFVCFALFVRPALRRMQGCTRSTAATFYARLAAPYTSAGERREFVRARIHHDALGVARVMPVAQQGSHHVRALSGADCLLDIPARSGSLETGHIVQTLMLDSVP